MKIKACVAAAAAALSMFATTASASHIFVTNPTINGVALDSSTGFTNPTINATVGSILNVKIGIYDVVGGTEIQDYTMSFRQTGGTLTLTNLLRPNLLAGDSFANTIYFDFDQVLTAVGTWDGFLEPIQGNSCPSFRYANGVEGGDGCGNPSESLPFFLNVTAGDNNVPEPGSAALIALGLLGLSRIKRRSVKQG